MAGPKLKQNSYVDQLCAPYYKKRPGGKFNHLNFSQTKDIFLQTLASEEQTQKARIVSINKAIKDLSSESILLSTAISNNLYVLGPLKKNLGRTPTKAEAKNFLQGELRRYQYRISMIERTRGMLTDFAYIPETQLSIVLQNAIALWEAIKANMRSEGEYKYRSRVRPVKDKLDLYNQLLQKIQIQLGKNNEEFRQLRQELIQKRQALKEAWSRLRAKIAKHDKSTSRWSRAWRRISGTNTKEKELIKEKKALIAKTKALKAKEAKLTAQLQKVLSDPKIKKNLQTLQEQIESDPSVKDYCQWRQAGKNLGKIEHNLVETRRTQLNDMLQNNDPRALEGVVRALNENYKLSLAQIFAAKNKEQRDVVIEQKLGRHLILLRNIQNGHYRKEAMKTFDDTLKDVQKRMKSQGLFRRGAVYFVDRLAKSFENDKDNPLSKVGAVAMRALRFALKNRPLSKSTIQYIREQIKNTYLDVEKQIKPKTLKDLDQTKTELKNEPANTLSPAKIKYYQGKLASYPALSLWLSQTLFNKASQMVRDMYIQLHGVDSNMLHADSKMWHTLAAGIDTALDGIPGISYLTKKLGIRVNGRHLGRWAMLQLKPWGFIIKNKNGRQMKIPAAKWMNGPTTFNKRFQQLKTVLLLETAGRVGVKTGLLGAKAGVQILRYGAGLRFMPGANKLTVIALQKLATLSSQVSILPTGTLGALKFVGSGAKQTLTYAGKKLTGKAVGKLGTRALTGGIGAALILADALEILVQSSENSNRAKLVLEALKKYRTIKSPSENDKKKLRTTVFRHITHAFKKPQGVIPVRAFGHGKFLSKIPYEASYGRIGDHNFIDGSRLNPFRGIRRGITSMIEEPGDPQAQQKKFTAQMKEIYPKKWKAIVQKRNAENKQLRNWIATGKGPKPRFTLASGISTIKDGSYLRILMQTNLILGTVGVEGFPLDDVLKSMKVHVIEKNASYQKQLKIFQKLRQHAELLIRNKKHTRSDIEKLVRQAKTVGYGPQTLEWLKRQGISANETIAIDIESTGEVNNKLRKIRQIKENLKTKTFSAYGMETKISKQTLGGWKVQGLDFKFNTKAQAKRAWITASFLLQNAKKHTLANKKKPYALTNSGAIEIQRGWTLSFNPSTLVGSDKTALSELALYNLGLISKKDRQNFVQNVNMLFQMGRK